MYRTIAAVLALPIAACAADPETTPEAPDAPVGVAEQAYSDNLPSELQVALTAPTGWTAQAEIWARVSTSSWQSTKPTLAMWHAVPEGGTCDTLGMGFGCSVGGSVVRIDCPTSVQLDEPVAVRMSSAGQQRHQGWLDWDAWGLGDKYQAFPELSQFAQPTALRISLYGGQQDALVCRYNYGDGYRLTAR